MFESPRQTLELLKTSPTNPRNLKTVTSILLLDTHMNFFLPPLSSMDSEFVRSPPEKAWHVYNIRSDLDLYTNIIK